jgi:hypothetical protein
VGSELGVLLRLLDALQVRPAVAAAERETRHRRVRPEFGCVRLIFYLCLVGVYSQSQNWFSTVSSSSSFLTCERGKPANYLEFRRCAISTLNIMRSESSVLTSHESINIQPSHILSTLVKFSILAFDNELRIIRYFLQAEYIST